MSLQEENTALKRRLERLETWEPRSVNMQAWLSANLAIVGGAGAVTIPFDSVLYDTRSTFSAYTFTAPINGFYLAQCQGAITGGAGNLTVTLIHSDGVQTSTVLLPLTITYFNFSHYFEMDKDETLYATISSTGNTTLTGSNSLTALAISLVGG